MKLMKSLALIMGLLFVSYFVGATVYQWTLDSDHNGTPEFRIDTDGNTEIAGTLAVTGATTQTGALTVTGAATINNTATVSGATLINDILSVSSDNANNKMHFGGAFTTLPTSGFSAYSVIMFIGTDTGFGSPAIMCSTATVTTASCWRALQFK